MDAWATMSGAGEKIAVAYSLWMASSFFILCLGIRDGIYTEHSTN